jgi:putative salt-induced outer membrane protein YdiY
MLSMNKAFLILSLFSFGSHAQLNIMRALFMAEDANYAAVVDDELSMTSEFGMLIASGNTNTSTLLAKMNTSQEFDSWSYQIIGDVLYKESEKKLDDELQKETSAQKVFVSTQLDYKLSEPDQRLFVYGEYEDKRFGAYRYQAAFATGWSARLWHNTISEFKYSIGPGYAISELADRQATDKEQGLIVRAALEYKRKLSEQASFRQFLSTEADQSHTKTKSETSLSTKITGSLAMKLSFIMNHNNNAEIDHEELDTETAVTLVYQFF